MSGSPEFSLVQSQADLDMCYEIRRAVFVVEQSVPLSEEFDTIDAKATHVLGRLAGRAVATGRFYRTGQAWRIGRIAVVADARGAGYGAALMRFVMAYVRHTAAEPDRYQMELDAQLRAISFYERLGFTATGPEFDDGSGILHRKMALNFEK
jgi:ElaA protein